MASGEEVAAGGSAAGGDGEKIGERCGCDVRRSPRPAGRRVAVWAHSVVKGKDDSAQEVVSFVVSFCW